MINFTHTSCHRKWMAWWCRFNPC